jgi:D-sedoheptulose 7-phosphate isomerase
MGAGATKGAGMKLTEAALRRAAARSLGQAARNAAAVQRANAAALARVAAAVAACLRAGGTVYTCGNGGSAADAQHLACELSGKFLLDRAALPSVALTTNTSALTAIANDFGYEQVFARQLEGLAWPGDLLVAFSTSGRSPSVRRAVRVARRRGMVTVAFTGARGRAFARLCDHAVVVPSPSTPRIQEGHLALFHALCELVERALFTGRGRRGRG